MLLMLFQWLAKEWRFFNVFNYITLRAVLAAFTAFLIALLSGPWVIQYLRNMKFKQPIRQDGPQEHAVKQGTPTMGGILILSALSISCLLWNDLENRFVWIILLITLGFGSIGFIDDWLKVTKQNSDGLSQKQKLFAQTLLGIPALVALYLAISAPNWNQSIQLAMQWFSSDQTFTLSPQSNLIVPFLKTVSYPLGLFGFIVLGYFTLVGSSNAVNLTDGLDGLAIVPVMMVAAGLGVFAYASGHSIYAHYLYIPYIPGAGEMLIFCAALVGAGLGFLWYNAYPAEVFMGDVGALALGAALAGIAIIVRQELVFAFMGLVFVWTAISVLLQQGFFKWTRRQTGQGKRIFLMAPYHHHLQKKKWSETQIVVRYWIITVLLVLAGLSTLKLR